MKKNKRKYDKCPPELMVNVKTKYLRKLMHERDVNQSEISTALGYCPEYLSNSISDGRMQIAILELLSRMLDFPYKDALDKKSDLDDFLDL